MSEASADARPPEFDIVRRGYDRGSVDAWAAEIAARLEGLQRERDALAAQLTSLGLKDSVDLQAEIEAISGEVARILHAARSAADAMRTRAAEDAAAWQASAKAEASSTRADAAEAASAMRGSAWDTSVEMLEQVRAEAEAQMRAAKQDVLLVRAEAEQEAHRLTAGARRDIEEETRAARFEAERRLAAAKAESEKMIESARLEAEAAQERAAALEQRRGELMAELEEARAAIGALEADLETRRQALNFDFAAGHVEPTTVRVIDPSTQEEPWSEEGTGVRILPGGKPGPSEPVDADAMAAEVRRLRQEAAPPPAPQPESEPPAAAAAPAEGLPDVQAPAPPGAAPEPVVTAEPEPVSEPEPVPELEPVPEPEPVPPLPTAASVRAEEPAEPDEPAAEPEVAAGPDEPAAEPEVVAEPAAQEGGIDSLFARLRGGPADPPSVAVEATADPPVAAAEAPADPPVAAAEAPATAEERPATVAVDVDPFELRDRMLLPITNRALREAKRVILDLQNVALERLRVEGDGWRPESREYQGALHEALAPLLEESHLAGVEAVAELTGSAVAVDPPNGGLAAEAVVAMALADAVGEVVQRAAGSGAGQRSTSAAVSRVFRAWRSDEAERRLRSLSHGAYHAGLLAALAAAGVPSVQVRSAGIPCAECPGSAWDPAGGPPPGTVVPPALLQCACTVVPG